MAIEKGHAMKMGRHIVQALFLLSLWLGFGLQAHAQTDTVTYVYTDPQGTPLVEADAQGNVVARYDYTPYGSSVVSLGNPPDGPGYTGHVNDPETGLVYMQARYYQPFGRFLSPDPVGPSPANLFSFNRYDYANNNPIVNVDPDGRETGIAFHAEWAADGGYVVPTSPNDKLAAPLMYAMGGLAAAMGGAEVVGMYRTAITIYKVLSDSPSPPSTSQGADAGELHAPGDVQNSTVIVRGGASEAPPGGTTYSGSQGTTVAEAARGVPHGQIRTTTVSAIRAAGGKVEVAPEPMKSGAINGQHVNITEAPGTSSLGELQPNPVPKPDRLN